MSDGSKSSGHMSDTPARIDGLAHGDAPQPVAAGAVSDALVLLVGVSEDSNRPDPHGVAPSGISETAFHAAVSKWMASHIHGSAISRNTASFNHLVASLPALHGFIMKEF